MREKWENRADYRERTILKAVASCNGNFYGSNKAAAPPADTSRLLITAAELEADIGPTDYVITGILEAGAYELIVGPPSSLKSFLVIDKAVCVAAGRPWHGHDVPSRGVVVYVCGEGGGGVAKRVLACCNAYGIKMSELPLVVTRCAVPMIENDAQITQLTAEIKGACERFGLPLILLVVDTMNANFGPGDENNAADAAAFCAGAKRLAQQAGAAIAVVHHTGHANGERGRGSSAIRASADAEFLIERYEADTPLGLITMTAKKMKNTELPPVMTFQPRVVELGFHEHDGRPLTSLVLDKISGVQSLSRARTLLAAIVREPGQTHRKYAAALDTSVASISRWADQLKREKMIRKNARGQWKPTAAGISTVGFEAAISNEGER